MSPIRKIFFTITENLFIPFYIIVGIGGLWFELWITGLLPEVYPVLYVLYVTFPVWGPPMLALVFYYAWIEYRRSDFIRKQPTILLEIRLPRDVKRTPQAMEAVLAGLHITGGETTAYDVYVKGKMRTWFSLEIVSIDGVVHFFIWTRAAFKDMVESLVYAYYPEAEVFEVDDYTKQFPYFDESKMFLYGTSHKLTKDDPYPIRTYVDWGIDKTGEKEEEKTDPLNSVIELAGMLGKGENLWIQIMIRAHKGKYRPHGIFGKKVTVIEEGEELIRKIQKQELVDVGEGKLVRFPSKTETDVMAAIHRAISKPAFDVGMRFVYIAKKENFDGRRIPVFRTMLKPFWNNVLNAISPTRDTTYDWPWQDPWGWRETWKRTRMLEASRRRSYFWPPYVEKPFILSTEELATIFHIPGQTTTTPTLLRLPSKKSSAPANLPR